MTEGISRTGRFRYAWKGDEYYIVDLQTGREFHLGLILNYQVATEVALNTCAVLEALVAYDPQDYLMREKLIVEMRSIQSQLTCPRLCEGCNMQDHDGREGYWYLACYIKSRVSVLTNNQ